MTLDYVASVSTEGVLKHFFCFRSPQDKAPSITRVYGKYRLVLWSGFQMAVAVICVWFAFTRIGFILIWCNSFEIGFTTTT